MSRPPATPRHEPAYRAAHRLQAAIGRARIDAPASTDTWAAHRVRDRGALLPVTTEGRLAIYEASGIATAERSARIVDLQTAAQGTAARRSYELLTVAGLLALGSLLLATIGPLAGAPIGAVAIGIAVGLLYAVVRSDASTSPAVRAASAELLATRSAADPTPAATLAVLLDGPLHDDRVSARSLALALDPFGAPTPSDAGEPVFVRSVEQS